MITIFDLYRVTSLTVDHCMDSSWNVDIGTKLYYYLHDLWVNDWHIHISVSSCIIRHVGSVTSRATLTLLTVIFYKCETVNVLPQMWMNSLGEGGVILIVNTRYTIELVTHSKNDQQDPALFLLYFKSGVLSYLITVLVYENTICYVLFKQIHENM